MSACPHWSDGKHAFTQVIWVDVYDGNRYERGHPASCVPRRPNDALPDEKRCDCGETVRKREEAR